MRHQTSSSSRWYAGLGIIRARTGRAGPAQERRAERRQRPRLEALEGRALLSTITVNTFGDPTSVPKGQTTLRMAIGLANSNSGPDTIVLPAGTFQLTQGKMLEVTNPGKVTIRGASPADPSTRTIDALGKSRVFAVDLGCEVEFDGLQLTNGKASEGGAIINTGTIELNTCTLENSSATTDGGGLSNWGTATATNTWFLSNKASQGAGVDNEFAFAANHCLFSGNTATTYGGGLFNDYGSTRAGGATATITGGAIAANAAAYGGGVFGSGTTNLNNVNFVSNTAQHDGGGVANVGTMTISGGSMNANSAASGGAIWNHAPTAITLQINNADIESNNATTGGGVYNDQGSVVVLNNSTVDYNTAATEGGGIYSVGNSLFSVQNWIMFNTAATGGGIANRGSSDGVDQRVLHLGQHGHHQRRWRLQRGSWPRGHLPSELRHRQHGRRLRRRTAQ